MLVFYLAIKEKQRMRYTGNATRTYFLFIFLGILTPLMIMLGGLLASIEVSAQGEATATPTFLPNATLGAEDLALPPYRAEVEDLPLHGYIEGTLTAEQTRYVYRV